MAITGAYWDPARTADYRGYDVHLVRNGKSTNDIRKALMITSSTAVTKSLYDYMTASPDPDFVSVSITPSFSGGGVTTLVGNVYSAYNVNFNRSTCIITANPLTGTGIEHKQNFNFHVEINITATSWLAMSPPQQLKKYFRVHVHNNITRAYLTPDKLTLHQGNTECRFSIYGVFSDNTIGDISCHPGFTWTCNNGAITFQDDGRMTASSQVLDGSGNPIELTVTATLNSLAAINNPGGNLAVTTGKVLTGALWTNPTEYAEPIGANPEPATPANAFNILFLPDGFLSTDKTVFQGLTYDAAAFMRGNPAAMPWGLISKNKINYWRAFLPSRQQAASCLDEIIPYKRLIQYLGSDYVFNPATSKYTFTKPTLPARFETVGMGMDDFVRMADSYLNGSSVIIKEYNVDETKHPFTQTEQRNKKRSVALTPSSVGLLLYRLISKTGLPTPKDALISISTLRQKWRDLFDPGITTYDQVPAAQEATINVPLDTYRFWIDMNDRRLLNERDTVLGIATGSKPHMLDVGPDYFPPSRGIEPHPFRVSRTGMNPLISGLKNGSGGPVIGAVWAINAPSFNFVAILSAGTRFAGTRSTGMLALGIKEFSEIRYNNSGLTTPELQIAPYPLPLPVVIQLPPLPLPLPPLPIISYNLLDITKCVIAHEFAHTLYLHDEYAYIVGDLNADPQAVATVNSSGNLMLKSQAENGMGQVEGDRVKWRWLRIKAGGEVVGNISLSSQDAVKRYYSFIMLTNHAAQFLPNDLVRFRNRNLALVTASQVDPAQYSPQVKIDTITALNATQSTINVSLNLADGPINANFNNGLLVMLVDSQYKGSGQVTTSVSGSVTTVTGVGTKFKSQFLVGYSIVLNNVSHQIATIGSDITMTINSAAPGVISPAIDYMVAPINKYSELLSDIVRIAMNETKLPMTPVDPNSASTLNVGDAVQTPIAGQVKSPGGREILADLKNPAASYQVVGLYAGAKEYTYGGFHPTGWCAMRGPFRTFCPVCRYVIVDLVDPSQHGKNNSDYDLIYPELK